VNFVYFFNLLYLCAVTTATKSVERNMQPLAHSVSIGISFSYFSYF